MKKFSFVKNFTNVKIYRKRFQKKPLSKKFKNVPRGTKKEK